LVSVKTKTKTGFGRPLVNNKQTNRKTDKQKDRQTPSKYNLTDGCNADKKLDIVHGLLRFHAQLSSYKIALRSYRHRTELNDVNRSHPNIVIIIIYFLFPS